jgi:uncharacterized membrane protein YebE (DUF533 family)
MIDADKILNALRTDPAAALRDIGGQLSEAGGDLAERIKTDPAARNAAIAAGGGVLAGMLAGSSSPRFAGALAKLGGVAALGGLAWYAWKRHEEGKAGQPHAAALAPPPTDFQPGGEERQRLSRLMLKAMINAAKADGKIDTEEKARLFDRLGQIDLSAEERDFLFDELARPLDTEGLVGEASTPAIAAQLYAASLLIVDPDRPAEQAYLADLATRLGLSPALAAEIRAAA